MSLEEKIVCNGVRPKKCDVYRLAAELAEVESIGGFRAAVVSALRSYDYDYDPDYYDYDPDYDYYDPDYDYYYYYDYDCDYDYYYYDYDYYYLTQQEKVITLLLLSDMHS